MLSEPDAQKLRGSSPASIVIPSNIWLSNSVQGGYIIGDQFYTPTHKEQNYVFSPVTIFTLINGGKTLIEEIIPAIGQEYREHKTCHP